MMVTIRENANTCSVARDLVYAMLVIARTAMEISSISRSGCCQGWLKICNGLTSRIHRYRSFAGSNWTSGSADPAKYPKHTVSTKKGRNVIRRPDNFFLLKVLFTTAETD